MNHDKSNKNNIQDVDASKQNLDLVNDVDIDDNFDDTQIIDTLAVFQDDSETFEEEKKTIKMEVVEVGYDEDIPFEPTRELKIKRTSSYTNDSEEYKERVIVTSSDDNVGVKKIIIGDDTTTLPAYKKPKWDFKVIKRDILIYVLMVAIMSLSVILLIKYCNNSKKDKQKIVDVSISSKMTAKLVSAPKYTETITTIISLLGNTENDLH